MTIDCNTLITRFTKAVRRGVDPEEAWSDVLSWLDALLDELLDSGLTQAAENVQDLGGWWCEAIDPRQLAADARS